MLNLYGFWPSILQGLWITIQLALAALAFGLTLGLLGALAKGSKWWPVRGLATAYTSLVRGIPELLIILLVYFGASQFLMMIASLFGYDDYIEISAFSAGVFALGFVFGAYATEVFRAAILAVPPGQAEAAKALGLKRLQAFVLILLPQLWRHALPGLSNLFLVLLKDTSMVSVIGVTDLMRMAYVGAGSNKAPFTFYLAAAIMYLLMTIVVMQLQSKLEARSRKGLVR